MKPSPAYEAKPAPERSDVSRMQKVANEQRRRVELQAEIDATSYRLGALSDADLERFRAATRDRVYGARKRFS